MKVIHQRKRRVNLSPLNAFVKESSQVNLIRRRTTWIAAFICVTCHAATDHFPVSIPMGYQLSEVGIPPQYLVSHIGYILNMVPMILFPGTFLFLLLDTIYNQFNILLSRNIFTIIRSVSRYWQYITCFGVGAGSMPPRPGRPRDIFTTIAESIRSVPQSYWQYGAGAVVAVAGCCLFYRKIRKVEIINDIEIKEDGNGNRVIKHNQSATITFQDGGDHE